MQLTRLRPVPLRHADHDDRFRGAERGALQRVRNAGDPERRLVRVDPVRDRDGDAQDLRADRRRHEGRRLRRVRMPERSRAGLQRRHVRVPVGDPVAGRRRSNVHDPARAVSGSDLRDGDVPDHARRNRRSREHLPPGRRRHPHLPVLEPAELDGARMQQQLGDGGCARESGHARARGYALTTSSASDRRRSASSRREAGSPTGSSVRACGARAESRSGLRALRARREHSVRTGDRASTRSAQLATRSAWDTGPSTTDPFVLEGARR